MYEIQPSKVQLFQFFYGDSIGDDCSTCILVFYSEVAVVGEMKLLIFVYGRNCVLDGLKSSFGNVGINMLLCIVLLILKSVIEVASLGLCFIFGILSFLFAYGLNDYLVR